MQVELHQEICEFQDRVGKLNVCSDLCVGVSGGGDVYIWVYTVYPGNNNHSGAFPYGVPYRPPSNRYPTLARKGGGYLIKSHNVMQIILYITYVCVYIHGKGQLNYRIMYTSNFYTFSSSKRQCVCTLTFLTILQNI